MIKNARLPTILGGKSLTLYRHFRLPVPLPRSNTRFFPPFSQIQLADPVIVF
jgi:hypothetical protein